MNLQESIRRILREQKERKEFLFSEFDNMFDNIVFQRIDGYPKNLKFISNGIVVSIKTSNGTLFIQDCDFYEDLRFYGKLIGIETDYKFDKLLAEYMNERYEKEFNGDPIIYVDNHNGC